MELQRVTMPLFDDLSLTTWHARSRLLLHMPGHRTFHCGIFLVVPLPTWSETHDRVAELP